ncbi:MAG TPA: LytTR family DNA-binding domain-containing protein [Terriglobales bacterium]|nr:LytTR family DNA-binding domain-containing protein [Terriglobales bacterium]
MQKAQAAEVSSTASNGEHFHKGNGFDSTISGIAETKSDANGSRGPALVQRTQGVDGSVRQHLRVISRGRIIVVPIMDIECFTAAANYVEIHVRGVTYTMRSTMNDLVNRLDARTFARIHRSTIVNLSHIKDCKSLRRGDSRVTLASGRELIATRNHRDFLPRAS